MNLHDSPFGFRAFAVLLLALFVGGCQSYALRGRVIEGKRSAIMVVDENDPRLSPEHTLTGIDSASLSFTLDPEKAGHKYLGATITNPDGTFEFPVDETGAGFLEYGLGVMARGTDKAPAVQNLDLPPANKRLLILLAPGRDLLPRESTDPLQDIDRYMPR